jgi:hypothetical protein
VEHPGIAAIFPRPHRASSSAKLLRGTTTKVECGGGEKNEFFFGNLQNLLQNWQQKKKQNKNAKEDTRIRRFVARKKEQMQMESQKRPPKR